MIAMLALFMAAGPITNQHQAQHDAAEFDMYLRLHKAQDAIDEIWRPSPKLLSDVRAARRCYTNFHLYKVDDCKAEFDKLDQDLGTSKK